MKYSAFIILLFCCSCTKEYIVDIFYTIRYTNTVAPTSSKLLSVVFIDEQTGLIGSEKGEVFKTTNQGATWIKVTSFTDGAIHKIYFKNASFGFACTSKGLYRTPNGGSSWTLVKEGDFRAIAFASENIVYAVGVGHYGGMIYKSVSNGQYWEEYLYPGLLSDLYAVAFRDELTGYAVGEDQAIYVTENGGGFWREGHGKFGQNYNDISFKDGKGFLSGDAGQLLIQTQNSSWNQHAEDFSYPLRAIDFKNEMGVAVGENSIVIGKTTQPDDWAYHYAPDGSTIANDYYDVAFCTSESFIAVGNKGVITKFSP